MIQYVSYSQSIDTTHLSQYDTEPYEGIDLMSLFLHASCYGYLADEGIGIMPGFFIQVSKAIYLMSV